MTHTKRESVPYRGAVTPDTKRYSGAVNADIMKEFKQKAKNQRRSVANLINMLIEDYCNKDEEKR